MFKDVPWLRRSVAGLLPRRARFDSRWIHVRFVVDSLVLGQVSLRVILLHVALSTRANGGSVRTFEKVVLFRKMGEHLTGKDFHFVGLESGKAISVFQVVENLSSVSEARKFIYVFTKAHLSLCPVSDVSWPQRLISFIWVWICLRLRLFLPIGLFLSRFCAKTSYVFITFCDIVISVQGGLVGFTLKPQTGGPPFLSCPSLIFQYICKNCSRCLQSEDTIAPWKFLSLTGEASCCSYVPVSENEWSLAFKFL